MKIKFECVRTAFYRLREKKAHFAARLRQGIFVTVASAFVLVPVMSAILNAPVDAKPAGDCDLSSARGEIKHVIYIQFDNVHFTRDNPNVPSDLEQMPNLLDFMTDNGVVMSNHHTPLKSHTADDIVTSLTGVYGDQHGIPIANSFGWFLQPASSETPTHFDGFGSSFTYWTDPVNATTDPVFEMITSDGKNAPAPWVPWTRAGCNVGAVSIANMELENVSSDVKTVFASDPTVLAAALAEASAHFNEAVADFEGISVHCAAGNAVCSSTNHGEPDILPQEPGGYTGFNALYGHKFVAPQISAGPLDDLDGNLITDGKGDTGFPGFSNISASQTLAYVAAMQENGIPITYAYISDAHDNHSSTQPNPSECKTDAEFGGLGPGDECYEMQLAAYDEAFGKFFARLAADGIDKSNTLFIITADEGDHFAGGPPTPSTCDGTPGNYCSYAKLGEIDSNLTALLDTEDPGLASTPFDIQFDMVPVFYVEGEPAIGAPIAREYERDAATLTAVSPITGATDQLTKALADPVELKLLHMVTGDPIRTPTFVMFGNPDWYWETFGPVASESPAFVWNHGGIQHEIVTTWLGMVGPGVKNNKVDDDVWSDHTDIRPTMLVLTGLKDDYQHEGRALVEELHDWALPDGVSDSGDDFTELARTFKMINAPNADLGRASLRISTKALASGSPGDDSKYITLENELSDITFLRDDLASQMLTLLEDAEFHGKRISESKERDLDQQAEGLLDVVQAIEAGL